MKYECKLCNYFTDRKADFRRHHMSKKHKKYIDANNENNLNEPNEQNDPNINKIYNKLRIKCLHCGLYFSRTSSLGRHAKQCYKRSEELTKFKATINEKNDKIDFLEKKLTICTELIKNFRTIINNPQKQNYKSHNSKKSIPKKLKNDVWNKYIGINNGLGKCHVCEDIIDSKHFEAGHVVAESKGGTTTCSNLRPICGCCNKSMSTMNMNEYKNAYYS